MADPTIIDRIRSLDPSDPNISPHRGLCRYDAGEDGAVRRAKEEKVAQSMRAQQGFDGFVPAERIENDGEYIGFRREGVVRLYCIAWREVGQWRRITAWSETVPESKVPHLMVLFTSAPPKTGGELEGNGRSAAEDAELH